jgi:hypothetical protein
MTDASTETNVFTFRPLPVAIVSCSQKSPPPLKQMPAKRSGELWKVTSKMACAGNHCVCLSGTYCKLLYALRSTTEMAMQ